MRQPLRVTAKEEQPKPKPPLPVVPSTRHHGIKAASKSPELEEMEVGSRHLDINDIDILDSENPQLCAEYVKDIYQYMLELEVRLTMGVLQTKTNCFSGLNL